MLKILRVGDPHAKVSNLDEMHRLINFVAEQAVKHNVDRIELLGDLMHTHAVVRLEVQEFWMHALGKLSDLRQTVVLVGNHDISGNYSSTFSSLSTFAKMNKKNLLIVEKPLSLGVIAYAPYIHEKEEFIASALGLAENGSKVLVCHQTVIGARYENGLFAEDGIPTGEWSQKFTHVISGHIHAEQNFENIIYPGTPYWSTSADANKRKGIWIFEHDENTGIIVNSEFISTEFVCVPIIQLTYKEGSEEPVLASNARIALELVGTSAWVSQQKQKFKGKANIKAKITDSKIDNRKTGGNLVEFLNTHFTTIIDKSKLIALAKEMGIE